MFVLDTSCRNLHGSGAVVTLSCEYKLRVAKWRLVANIGGYVIANTQRDKRGAMPGVASVQLRRLHTFTTK